MGGSAAHVTSFVTRWLFVLILAFLLTIMFVSGCRRAMEQLVAGKVLIAHIIAKYVEGMELKSSM